MIAVVILAGGQGRRIGGGKPFRKLAGKSLLDHALAQARGWSSRIAVAIERGGSVTGGPNVPLLVDVDGEGPIAGIASAFRFCREGGSNRVLTIPCDTPFLPGDLLDRLAAALTGSAGAALATSRGRLHPTCALWRADDPAPIATYLASGRASLHAFAESVRAVAVEWPVEPIDPFLNINDESDLAAAEALIKNQ